MSILKCKKYEWIVNQKFATSMAERVKESIIDAFIRIRLKEGFKCVFQCSKFVVFTQQILMFDLGSNSSETTHKQTKSESTKSNASPQKCTFFYVIYFNIESKSAAFNKSNIFILKTKLTNRLNAPTDSMLNKLSTNIQDEYSREKQEVDSAYFRTEIYFEDIDGINKHKSAHNLASKDLSGNRLIEYFKNLSNLEIINLIYLIDMKAFLSLQSIYALFLCKSDFIENLSSFDNFSQVDLQSLCSDSILASIQNYNMEFFDSIRILPDLKILLRKHSFKTANKIGFAKSFNSANLHNRIDFSKKESNKNLKKGRLVDINILIQLYIII